MQNKEAVAKWVSDSMFIALVTAMSYAAAFVYEAGYFAVYNIPLHLIKIRLSDVLIIFFACSGFFWTCFLICTFLSMWWPKHPALQAKVIRILIVMIFPIWDIFLYGLKDSLRFLIISFTFIFVFEILWPFLLFRDKKGIKDRFVADEIAELPARERTLFSRIFSLVGPFYYMIFFICLFGGILLYDAGNAKAKTRINRSS